MLAQACEVDPDTAYLGGLVVRTGELLMLMIDPAAVADAEVRAVLPDSLLEHEKAVLQCTHVEVTGELARRWRFPALLVSGVIAAGDPLAMRPFSRLGAVLRLASVMSDAGERGLSATSTLREFQPELASHMNLDLDWLESRMTPWTTLTSGVDQMLH